MNKNTKSNVPKCLSNCQQDLKGNISSIGGFIVHNSHQKTIEEIVEKIKNSKFVMLMTTKAIGKKFLLREIASGLGYSEKSIAVIKLGAHVDCTDLVGNFVISSGDHQLKWASGLLLEAATRGYFLILDSWEELSTETIQFFINILDNNIIYLPNNNIIKIHDNFRMLSVCSSLTRRQDLQKHRWLIVHFPETDNEYLSAIVVKKFPNLNHLSGTLISIFNYISSNLSTNVNFRDFFRMCEFLSKNLNFDEDLIDISNSDLANKGIIKNPLVIIQAIFIFLLPDFQNIKSENLTEICKFLSLNSLDIFRKLLPIYKKTILNTKINKKLLENSLHNGSISKDSMVNGSVEKSDPAENISSANAQLDTTLLNKIFYIPESYIHILHNVKVSVDYNFPTLLIGETGVGKTSLVQAMAKIYNKKLVVINIGADSDISNSFGTLKHTKLSVNVEKIIRDFADDFTYIKNNDNSQFIERMLKTCKTNCKTALKAMYKVLGDLERLEIGNASVVYRLKNRVTSLLNSAGDQSKNDDIRLEIQLGVLANALNYGDWVLFDEINLASHETLSLIAHILENKFLRLSNFLSDDTIKIHPDFRLFACMNPANDVGKKSLPENLLKNFLKINVHEIIEPLEIKGLVSFYLEKFQAPKLIENIQKFYIDFKNYFQTKSHVFSENVVFTRQLCRALTSSINNTKTEAINIGVFNSIVKESLRMCFLSKLSDEILTHWESYLNTLFGENKLVINDSDNKILVEGFYISKGNVPIVSDPRFIITDVVKSKIKSLARIISLTNIPILLEGETAAGKTSLIVFLAQITGNSCIRINNHEHSDIQDYLGSYTLSSDQTFTFKEGALLKAMRTGQWVIIDELNLASSDVLEMLNRLLDDNREIFVEELQEYVKAHANFRIFATQNPSESYSGRKQLSRAFRSRFIELDFSELSNPDNIKKIIEKRFNLKQQNVKYMIDILKKLSLHRKNTQIFSGKLGFITIRDLIKWCLRLKSISNLNLDKIAIVGFHLLSSRCRDNSDILQIQNIFSDLLNNKKILQNISFNDCDSLNKLIRYANNSINFQHLLWTKSLIKNGYYLNQALINSEPVLLVGETGSGKTTLCQLFAEASNRKIFIYNCHSNTESSDIVGFWTFKVKEGKKEFIWQDGPLLQAMKCGGLFLLDEISLADDAVIERINSVLENDVKSLILYEKFGLSDSDIEIIKAHKNFLLVATMNPSGDYGKRELSYALRNRFTEIWLEASNNFSNYETLIQSNINFDLILIKINNKSFHTPKFITSIFEFLKNDIPQKNYSVRKILSLIYFINNYTAYFLTNFKIISAIMEGFKTIFCDSFDEEIRTKINMKLSNFISTYFDKPLEFLFKPINITQKDEINFHYNKVSQNHVLEDTVCKNVSDFEVECDEIALNINRLKIAMCFKKPIMLEGPPGSGKTKNVSFIAKSLKKQLFRINFCEQTEISDIIGSFVPIFKENDVFFEWIDGPFLEAIKNKGIILLDELNLACQTVIEGLNSCFDHRSSLYIPELNRTFPINRSEVIIFATQNPHFFIGRKGLPKSLLDRFIILNFQSFSSSTLYKISKNNYPSINNEIIQKSVNFIFSAIKDTCYYYNIRDASRHFQYLYINKICSDRHLSLIFFITFFSKIRTCEEIESLSSLALYTSKEKIGFTDIQILFSYYRISAQSIKIFNNTILFPKIKHFLNYDISKLRFLPHQFKYFGIISTAINMNWPCLITGSSMSGKTSIFKILSLIHGAKAYIISLTGQTDSSDLIGDYSYIDYDLKLSCKVNKLIHVLTGINAKINLSFEDSESKEILETKLKSIHGKFDKNTNDLIKKCLNLLDLSKKQSSVINMKWSENLLVKCMKKGYWICFDNINFCNSAIIDRLNSLFEPNGSLHINYKTNIQPHPNFRFFGIYDPSLGEISAALRNRCFEVFIHDYSRDCLKTNYHFIDSLEKFPLVKSLNINQTEIFKQEYGFIHTCVKASTYSECIKKLIFMENSIFSDYLNRYKFINTEPCNVAQFVKTNIIPELNNLYSKNGFPLTDDNHIFSWMNRIFWCINSESNNAIDNQTKLLFIVRFQIFHQEYFKQLKTTSNQITAAVNYIINKLFITISQTQNFNKISFCSFYLLILILHEICLSSSKIERCCSIFNHYRQVCYSKPELLLVLNNLNCLTNVIRPDDEITSFYHYLYFNDESPFFKISSISENDLNLINFGRQVFLEELTKNSNPQMNHLLLIKYLYLMNKKSLNDISISSNFNPMLYKYKINQLEKVTGCRSDSGVFDPANLTSFKLLSRFVLNDFNSFDYTPFSISKKWSFSELIKMTDHLKTTEGFLENNFPFFVSCQDSIRIKNYMDHVSSDIICNFNIYTSWNKILAKTTTELLEYLIIYHLKYFNPKNYDENANIVIDGAKIFFKKNVEFVELLENLKNLFKSIKMNETDNKLVLIGKGFTLLGIFILKTYRYLPIFDPNNRGYFFQHFNKNWTQTISHELESRFNFMNMFVSLPTREYLKRYDQSYLILDQLKTMISSFDLKRPYTYRNSQKFVEFKQMFEETIANIFKFASAQEVNSNLLKMAASLRINISNKYREYRDFIEPLYIGLVMIEIGQLIKKPNKHHIFSIGVLDEDMNDELSYILGFVFEVNSIIIKQYRKQYISKNQAIEEFHHILKRISKFIKQVFQKIECLDSLNVNNFKVVQPEIKYEYFEPEIKPIEKLSFINNKNKNVIIRIVSKFAFYVLEKLDYLLSGSDSNINILKIIEKNNLYTHITTSNSDSSVLDQILQLSNFKTMYSAFIDQNISNHTNIYECGFSAYALKISASVSKLDEQVRKLNIKNSVIVDEIYSLISQINNLDISSPLIIFLNRLDKLYQNMENLSLTIHSSEITDSICILKNIIIDIRRVQFDCWSFILNDYDEKCIKDSSLIYFEILESFETFLDSQTPQFPPKIQSFIENQTIATYEYSVRRIKSLLMILQSQYSSSPQFSNCVNFINFYEQFFPHLKTYRDTHTDEIRKSLLEFSKFSKWRDFNYWSIKESSIRAHITLHKYVKKYQTFVDQPINILLKNHPQKSLDVANFKIDSFPAKIIHVSNFSHNYTINPNIQFNYDIIKLCSSFSNKLNSDCKFILDNFYSKFLFIQENLVNSKIDNIFNNSYINREMTQLHILNTPKFQVSIDEICTDINSYVGPVDFMIPKPFKATVSLNNGAYMRGLYLIQKIISKIAVIKTPTDEISKINISIWNMLRKTKKQRKYILELFKVYDNLKLINQIFKKFDFQKSDIISLPEKKVQNILLKLSKIIEKIYELKSIMKLNSNISQEYASPYFPNSKLNHSIINDRKSKSEVLSKFSQISENIKDITTIFNENIQLKFVNMCTLINAKNKIHDCISKVDEINKYMEIFSLFSHNSLIEFLKNIDEIFSQVMDELNIIMMSKTKINFKFYEKDIQLLIQKLLLPLQTVKTTEPDLKYDKINSFTDSLIKSFSEISEEYILNLSLSITSINQINLFKNIHQLVSINLLAVENYINFYIRMNSINSFLFYLFSETFLKTINLIDKKDVKDSKNDDANRNSELTQEPAEMGGFQDGKGHDDVSKQIPDQDVFEDAIPKEKLFDSSSEVCSDYQSVHSEENSGGLEVSDVETNFEKFCSKLKEEEQNNEIEEEIEEAISSVSQSVCNELNPEIWNEEIESLESKDEAKTDIKNMDIGEFTDSENQPEDDVEMDISNQINNEDEIQDEIEKNNKEMDEDSIGNDNTEEKKESIKRNGNLDENSQSDASDNEGNHEMNNKGINKNSSNFENNENGTGNGEGPDKSTKNNESFGKENRPPNKRTYEPQNQEKTKIKRISEAKYSENENLDKNDNSCAQPSETVIDAGIIANSKNNFNKISPENLTNGNIDSFENKNEVELIEDSKIDSKNANSLNKIQINENLCKNEKDIKEIEKIDHDMSNINFYEFHKEALNLAIILGENLRIILEPTRRTKFQGNYKSGRKINLRKIIPYIASKFTKDKIWLRRVKPHQREYKVMLAIDDSSSMRDNKTRQIALVSLLAISTALRLIEIGKVSIVSFGETVKTLLDFDETLNEEKEKNIWESLNFHQTSTKIDILLKNCKEKFLKIQSNSSYHLEKLLIIISDGRGVYSQGESNIKTLINDLKSQNILVIFIIMDNINEKQNISNINVPIFDENSKIKTIKPYLEIFPFQYYMILKNPSNLPEYLSNIIRQWIQITYQ